MVYYLAIDGAKTETLTRFQVLESIESGEADASTLAWSHGMDGWRPLGELMEFEGAFRQPDSDSESSPESPKADAEGSGREKRNIWVDREPRGRSKAAGPKPQPWMRLFARGVDLILLLLVFELVFALLLPGLGTEFAQNFTARLIAHSLMILVWCFIEALLLSTWGTTPGKALFRVKIRDREDGILSYKIALQRSILVWVKGLALMFVWVTPVAMMIAHARLMVFGVTSWDRDLQIRVSHGRPGQVQMAVVIAIYVAFAYLLIEAFRHQMEEKPPEGEKKEGEGRPGENGGEERPGEYPDDLV